MSLPRISIKKFMAFVVLIAVVIAALARPTHGWAALLCSSYVMMLLTAILGVILRRGLWQAYWVGFGVFGWGFFLSVTFLDNKIRFGGIAPEIFDVLACILDMMISARELSNADLHAMLSDLGAIHPVTADNVALSLMGLAFASLGGWIARRLARGGPFDPSPRTPD